MVGPGGSDMKERVASAGMGASRLVVVSSNRHAMRWERHDAVPLAAAATAGAAAAAAWVVSGGPWAGGQVPGSLV